MLLLLESYIVLGYNVFDKKVQLYASSKCVLNSRIIPTSLKLHVFDKNSIL